MQLAWLQALNRDKVSAAGAILLTAFIILAFVGPYIAPYASNQIVRDGDGRPLRLHSPSWDHPLGTTTLGRDIFSQVLIGTRDAMLIGGTAALVVVTVGTIIGLLAGYFSGITDSILMRMVDVAYALPTEPLAIILLAMVGPSLGTMILALSLLSWRDPARVLRAQVISIKTRPFIKAARVTGASQLRIMFLHIGPNILPLALMYLPIVFGRAVLNEAAISFLGFGAPQSVTWGQMMQEAFTAGAARSGWWWIAAPGLTLNLVILSVFFATRRFEERFNPRLRRD